MTPTAAAAEQPEQWPPAAIPIDVSRALQPRAVDGLPSARDRSTHG
jgi:hypothetical protein